MKCLVTGKETKDKCNGKYPLSKEARQLVGIIKEKYHEKILDEVKTELGNQGYDEKLLDVSAKNMSERLSTRVVLQLLEERNEDVLTILKEIDNEKIRD